MMTNTLVIAFVFVVALCTAQARSSLQPDRGIPAAPVGVCAALGSCTGKTLDVKDTGRTTVVADLTRLSRAPFNQIKYFTHETSAANFKIITEHDGDNAALLSRGELVQKGILKSNQDTKKGGGFYVYTRLVHEGTTTALGGGSKGASGEVMIAFSPILAARKDMWAYPADLMGGLPFQLCGTQTGDACTKKLSTMGFGTGIISPAMMARAYVGPRDKPPLVTRWRGAPEEQLLEKLPKMVEVANMPANEQGFFGSIPLKYAVKIIYKGSVTKAAAATALGLSQARTPYLYSILEVVSGQPSLGSLLTAQDVCKCPPFQSLAEEVKELEQKS